MTKIYHVLLTAALVVTCTVPVAGVHAQPLQSVVLRDFLPASKHSTARFTCVSENKGGAEVLVEYETVFSGPGEHVSHVKRMSLGDTPLPPGQVAQINKFVGTDSITGASAGCAGKDIRVSIQVFRPDSIAPTDCLADAYRYIFVHLDGETGAVRVD